MKGMHRLTIEVQQTNVACFTSMVSSYLVYQPVSTLFWRFDKEFKVELVDLRVRTLQVQGQGQGQGQEILTRDKVALRTNVTATFKMVDAAKAA